MEPQRSTRVIGVMALFLGTGAVVLGDAAFALAAFSLVLFSAALAIRFRQRMHRIVLSARVTRSADRRIVPQGGATAITTFFSCSPEPGTAVRLRDLHPPATIAEPADLAATLSRDGTATIRYRFTPLVPGSTRVTGIALTVSDPFYTHSLVMTTDPFCGPEIRVQPHGAYERGRSLQNFDMRERDMPIIYRGSGIRSIREYRHGDELRFIDWKLTAKHDRMFIREYTAAKNVPPLVILDLPDRSFPVPDDRMAALVSAVTGEAAAALRKSGSVSLVLISGVNMVDMLLGETDLRRVTMLIRNSAHPHFRLRHAYRWKNRTGMREALRKIGGSAPVPEEEPAFPARIAQVFRRNLASPFVPLFTSQVQQLLASRQIEEIVLYSLFAGDMSHVQEIASQARMQRIRLRLQTVEGEEAARLAAIRRMPGLDTPGVAA